ncbi:MAG: beta-ketoacyl synthase N-terminal-like domain-containing protein, partial [Alphaproteobacteria bacterium]
MTAARGRARARGERQAPRDGDIAIVGIAGRFAGAADIAEFTQAALAGRSLLGPPPDDRFEWHTPPNAAMHQGAGGYMADIDRFDAGIFGIGEREAARMDPQARLFLEAARGAFEDAGHAPRGLAGTEVGVFVAYTFQDWLQRLRRDDRVGRLRLTDVIAGALATRVSRAFDLRGPSEVFNAACAGSLLAVHRAAMAIRAGECEAALAGGVNLILSGDGFAMEARAGMLARGDESLALDRAASGFLRGEGVGAVLLKTVARARADRDAIRAIIRGSAAGHSGTSGVMSAADAARQGAIVARALRAAAVEPATLGHVELQCAGRPAEDAAELAVIAAGFHAASGTDTPADRLPAIGCLKPVAGHMEAASGIAQLAKTVALLSSAEIPAMPLLRDPSPLVVAAWPGFARAVGGGPWPEGRSQRRASISGFGFGGHHVHMVVEAPPQRPDAAAAMTERAFLLSAPDRDRLVRTASSLAAALDGAGHSAADVALTLLVGRDAMSERLAILASDLPELVSRLRAFVAAPESTGPWVRGRAAVSPPLLGTASEDREWLSAMVSGGRWRRLADLWASGLDFDWTAVAATLPGARVSLPAMALAQTRWWLDDAKPAVTPVAQPASVPPARTEQSRVGLLRELLAETLGIADATTLSMADGPVAVGLDSMAAMELRSRIADAGGPPPSLAAILAAPSLAVLAALMPERAEATPAIAADVAARGEPFPLTDIQLSYLLGRQGFSAGGGFGCQVHWMFARPRFQPQRLAAAIDRLVERHEMLRAVFGEDATQRILPVEQVPMCAVPVHDLTGLAP